MPAVFTNSPSTFSPSNVSRFTGVRRGAPDVRPRTSSTRAPHTPMPSRVSPATSRLNTFLVTQPGCLRSKCAAAGLVPASATSYSPTSKKAS